MKADPKYALPTHLLEDAAHIIGQSFSEIVPPEAQRHLLNAQSELLLGLAIILEHNASRTVRSPRAKPRTRRKPVHPKKVTVS